MTQKNTSTQHLPSPLLDGAGRTMRGSGDVFEGVPVPTVVNETKLGIVAFMRELSRPVTAGELFSLLGRGKQLAVLDYHLYTLVRAGVAKVVSGPELRFGLVNLGELTGFQGAVPLAPAKSERT